MIFATIRELEHVLTITKKSSLYETEPVGKKDQPWFFNMVIEGETNLSPEDLLRTCQAIEKKLGRVEGEKWGPRPIDIDILLYGDLVLNLPHLTIPHSRLHLRNFVLQPLSEIAPNIIHPISKKLIKELLKISLDTSKVQIIDN